MANNVFIGGKMDCQNLIYKSALNRKHDLVVTFREPVNGLGDIKYTKDRADHSNDTILCIGLPFGMMPKDRDSYFTDVEKLGNDELKFQQYAENIRMLTYLGRYKRIVHWIVDPYETPLSVYFEHAKCFSDYAYTSKQGIEVEAHDMYAQYLATISDWPQTKDYLLYFGTNEFTTGSKERKQWIELIHKLKPRLEDLHPSIKVFINTKDDKTEAVSQEQYLHNLARATFTLVGPANAPGHFSSLRVKECWAVGCTPLIWAHSNHLAHRFGGMIWETPQQLKNIITKSLYNS